MEIPLGEAWCLSPKDESSDRKWGFSYRTDVATWGLIPSYLSPAIPRDIRQSESSIFPMTGILVLVRYMCPTRSPSYLGHKPLTNHREYVCTEFTRLDTPSLIVNTFAIG